MILKYEEQEIDIAGADAKIFNQEKKQWERYLSNFSNVEIRKVFGRNIPIEPLDSLIAYKLKLAREVDLEDIRQLKELKGPIGEV